MKPKLFTTQRNIGVTLGFIVDGKYFNFTSLCCSATVNFDNFFPDLSVSENLEMFYLAQPPGT